MKKLVITGVTATIVFGMIAGFAGDSMAYARCNGCHNNCINTTVNQQPTSVNVISSSYDYGAQAAKNDVDLTLEEMLVYAIQDEYLAKAKYETAMDLYGLRRPFSNIESSEETHISALVNLFQKYNIDIPVEDEAMNYVVYPSNLNEAYKTGVTGEIENIDMYNRFLEENLPKDVKTVFTALRNASEKHLSTFQKHAR